MALTKIKSAGIADDAITADKLGGDLDFPGHVKVIDNKIVKVGTGADLQIAHDGTNSYLKNFTGLLQLRTDGFRVNNNANDEVQIKASANGAVELFFDDVKRFETTSAGISISGTIEASGNLDLPDWGQIKLGTGDDLLIYHNGSKSYIADVGAGSLRINSNDFRVYNAADSELMIRAVENDSVELYYDSSLKLNTSSDGATCHGNLSFADSNKVKFGTSDDLEIFHDGSNSYIKDVGAGGLILRSQDLTIQGNATTENLARFTENAQVDLYYDGSKKAYTYSEGLKVDGYLKALSWLADAHNGDNTGDYHTLQSGSESNATLLLEHSGNSTPRGIYMYFSDAAPDNATQYFLYCEDNSSSIRAKINSNGAFESADNSYGGISDIKLKENIVDAKSQWDDVKALKIRNFNFKRKPDTKLLGVVAQEVETISPGIVYESEDLEKGGVSKGTVTKGVKYSILYMKAIKALQEAMTRIETLETKVAILETK